MSDDNDDSAGRNDHPAEHAERLLNFLGSGTVRGIGAVQRETISGYINERDELIAFPKAVRVLLVYLEEEP
jgi:hypothetical protein